MPNTFAFVMVYAWPLVVLILFRALPLPKALCWSIIAGLLLLPERAGINFPMLPAIDKYSVPSLMATVMCLLLAYRDRLEEARLSGPGTQAGRGMLARLKSLPTEGGARAVFYILLAVVVLAPVFTVLNNRAPLIYGPRILPGLAPYDVGSIVQGVVISLLPFMLAMRFLATTERHVILLRTLVIAMVAYSLLALVEIRLSPQLNTWVYGFFPHSFAQHKRGGGFRPLVFLNHGLILALMMAMATVAACGLWRQALRARVAAAPWIMAALWLAVVLLLSRSLAAALLMLLFAPLALLLPPRMQILAAAVVAGLVLVFPMMRGAGLVPTDALVSAAAGIDPARAQSLEFRFHHEDMLLEKAAQQPLTGWGTFGRNRVYDEQTGRDLSVTDGAWVIIIGNFGWLGYLGRFGLLTLPIILLALRRRDTLSPATTGLALVAAVNLLDLIPNSGLTPVSWLVGGALAGRYLRQERWVTDPGGGRQAMAGAEVSMPAEGGLAAPAVRHVRRSRGASAATAVPRRDDGVAGTGVSLPRRDHRRPRGG